MGRHHQTNNHHLTTTKESKMRTHKMIVSSLAALTLTLLALPQSRAAIVTNWASPSVVTNSNPLPVSAIDLVNTGQPSLAGRAGSGWSRNGLPGTPPPGSTAAPG
jgi:hypothetical protein